MWRKFYGVVRQAQWASIAAATTTDFSTATGNVFSVTGNTTIVSFWTVAADVVFDVSFTGTPLLTYNATSLKLPSEANIQVVAGDRMRIKSLWSGNWEVLSYTKADGTALVVASLNLPPENLDQNIVLNENMTALDLVYQDNDGEANKWNWYKNTGDTFYAGSVTRAKTIMIDTNTVVCMFYRASSSYVVAGSIASGAITWGTPVAVAGNTNGFDLCKVDTNAGCIIQLSSPAFNGYPFTVSGTTITLGSPVQINGSTSNVGAQSPAITQISTNKVAFVYSSWASQSRQNMRIGTISSNALSLGTEFIELYGWWETLYGAVAKFDTDKCIAVGIDTGSTTLRYQSFTISGTTISAVGGGSGTITGLVTSSPVSLMEVSTNLILLAYNKASKANVRYVSFSANVPTLQTEYTISTTVFTNNTEARKFGCIYNDALFAFTLGSGANQMLFVERNDLSYILKTTETIATWTAGMDIWICQYKPWQIIAPVAQNPWVGYIFNNGARAIVGILRATGTAWQTKTVAINGAVSTGHVGLVPWEPYYAKTTGWYGLWSATAAEWGTSIRKIGVALTSTKMIVQVV